jgi:DNA-binding FadR family transcriptional regulator
MSIMFAGFERAAQNMSVKRHGDIVDAIETGDAAKASEAITEHMDGAAKVLVG